MCARRRFERGRRPVHGADAAACEIKRTLDDTCVHERGLSERLGALGGNRDPTRARAPTRATLIAALIAGIYSRAP